MCRSPLRNWRSKKSKRKWRFQSVCHLQFLNPLLLTLLRSIYFSMQWGMSTSSSHQFIGNSWKSNPESRCLLICPICKGQWLWGGSISWESHHQWAGTQLVEETQREGSQGSHLVPARRVFLGPRWMLSGVWSEGPFLRGGPQGHNGCLCSRKAWRHH